MLASLRVFSCWATMAGDDRIASPVVTLNTLSLEQPSMAEGRPMMTGAPSFWWRCNMIDPISDYDFLRPYLFLNVQDEPAIYFFISKAELSDGSESYYEVAYVGQAVNTYGRVQFGKHHKLKGDYVPNSVYYLTLRGAGADDLTAAENCFILLYQPEKNRRHMPRCGPGDMSLWATRLVDRVGRGRYPAFYRFLARKELELPDEGQPMWEVLCRELASRMSEDEQFQIIREDVRHRPSRVTPPGRGGDRSHREPGGRSTRNHAACMQSDGSGRGCGRR